MLIEKHEGIAPIPALMVWADLWPVGCEMATNGWMESLGPGISVLLDETGEDACAWVSMLAGLALPGRGHVQCAGLCSQADSAAYQAQVYWHNPRAHGQVAQESQLSQVSAQQWLQQQTQRWPSWSDAAWRRHCEGFGLAPHMDKPLWHLSTGCLRKLGIAAALSSGARLTLIEEPIGALDSQSIGYLCKALDALGEELAETPQLPRWVMVSHWEPLAGVTWDEVLVPPPLTSMVGAKMPQTLL